MSACHSSGRDGFSKAAAGEVKGVRGSAPCAAGSPKAPLPFLGITCFRSHQACADTFLPCFHEGKGVYVDALRDS